MQSRLRKDGDIHIIQIYGHLNYEQVDQFNQVCNQLLDEKVVFNFDGLQFVGSSGITSFFAAIENLAKRSRIRPKVCCMSLEFRRCIANLVGGSFDYYDSEFMALRSFHVKGVFAEDLLADAPAPAVLKSTGTEEPIGRAYVAPQTQSFLSAKVVYPRFSSLGFRGGDDN